MSNVIATEHNLDFEIAPWEYGHLDETIVWKRFRIGTCEGVWSSNDKSYLILAVTNNRPGNGHLNDVFQWFEFSCQRDNKSLKILEVWNVDFKKHLLLSRGFKDIGANNLEKEF